MIEHLTGFFSGDDSRVFWNPDMKVGRDLTIMLQLCCGWAALFAGLNRVVMNPLSRLLFQDQVIVAENDTTEGTVTSTNGLRQRKRVRLEETSVVNGKPQTVSEGVAKLRHKFATSMWKFVSYTFFVGFGLYAVSFESSWFWSPSQYHVVFRRGQIPDLLYWYYQLETSYYVFSLGMIAWEPKMKDRAQMTVHHIVTITLLVTSYVGRMMKFGVPIMLLHDAADPFMELAKMCLYCGYEGLANIGLALFAGTFMYLRNWVFPRHIIWTIYRHKEYGLYPYYKVTLGSLCTLAALHVYWAALIVKIAYGSIVAGKSTGDIREED
jgi:hypothetical protein